MGVAVREAVPEDELVLVDPADVRVELEEPVEVRPPPEALEPEPEEVSFTVSVVSTTPSSKRKVTLWTPVDSVSRKLGPNVMTVLPALAL